MTVIAIAPLKSSPGQPWLTADPFLFAVHHDDNYPAGDAQMAVPESLRRGRNIGSDFGGQDGFSMYHGSAVPGFPSHPHRGFETITIVRRGYIDHSDSLGATARIGPGDVQWMTAGAGIVHCEMFPLLESAQNNPTDFFQLWINLPAKSKMVAPHFNMQWSEHVASKSAVTEHGSTVVNVYAGSFGDLVALPPPPHSYAANPESGVAIATLSIAANAEATIPVAMHKDSNRLIYFWGGDSITIDGKQINAGNIIQIDDKQLTINAGASRVELLLLAGRPIGEPVVAHGPFVMNSKAEISRAISDYQRTQFGGWPWKGSDPIHARNQARFAKFPDGSVDHPPR
jgi:quercetin 2,3-dioxygenase